MGVSIREKVKGKGWWVNIRHRGRRTSKFVGSDKRAAERLAKEVRHALAAGDLGLLQEQSTIPTLAAFAERYLKTAKHTLKRSTALDYGSNVAKYLIPAFGTRPLDQIPRADVKQLALTLREKKLKPKTVRKIIGTLSTILNEAVDDGVLTSNPALGLRKVYRSPDFREDGGPTAATPLTRDELTHLLTTAREHHVQRGTKVVYPYRRHYPFLLLLARTGMRLGEAIALRWGDVDWHGGFIEVQRGYVRGRLTTPKNHKARRVDMSTQLQETLRTLYTERFETVEGFSAEDQVAVEEVRARAAKHWLFPDTIGGVLDADVFRRRIFAPLLTTAKMRHVRIHDLRHTYASLLIAAGKELHYIQQQLGHHSPAFTLSVYGHLLPRDRRGEVNCLDDCAVTENKTAPNGTPVAPEGDQDDAAPKAKAQ